MKTQSVKPPSALRVLLIEDNPNDAFFMKRLFINSKTVRFEVTHVEQMSEAMERLKTNVYEAILLDLALPDSFGLDAFRKLYVPFPDIPIVVLTISDDESMAIEAMRQGAQDYLVKGEMNISTVVRSLRYAIERSQLQMQIRKSQKMQAVGTLSGGIAHEFNNLLYVISGYAELLMDDAISEDKKMLQKIIKATQRGANLVKQLLAFSRKSESNLSPTHLNIEIRKIKKMLDRVLPRMIDIKLCLADDLASMKADQRQIEQVVMNLCLNAKDAMPDGGTLTIKTKNCVIDDTFVDIHLEKPKDLKEGKCIILTISDTGCGMDEETKERIFDPFFSTKGVGKGTGLGLSVIYGIIQGHDGHISCDSEIEAGTTFKIYFPAIEDNLTASTSDKDTGKRLSKGIETILIVDDEETIIEMTQAILDKSGYKTISADTGESALDIYTEKRNEIDLILLDLGMPGMGGKKCLEKLIEFDPDVKVIVASGYSEEGLIRETINIGAKGYAVKPLTRDELLKSIREVWGKN